MKKKPKTRTIRILVADGKELKKIANEEGRFILSIVTEMIKLYKRRKYE